MQDHRTDRNSDTGLARAAAHDGNVSTLRRRVLVVEDNHRLAESLCTLLGYDGHEVAVAHDGLAAIDVAQTFLPDVVLCDTGLPEMDGFAVARRFRGDAALGSPFLIAMSGNILPEHERKALEAGFDAHVTKPISVDALRELLAVRRSTM